MQTVHFLNMMAKRLFLPITLLLAIFGGLCYSIGVAEAVSITALLIYIDLMVYNLKGSPRK